VCSDLPTVSHAVFSLELAETEIFQYNCSVGFNLTKIFERVSEREREREREREANDIYKRESKDWLYYCVLMELHVYPWYVVPFG
jgi:hypothetical protein